MPRLSLYGAIHLIVYEQIDVLCLVLVVHAQLFSSGFEVDDLVGEVVVVGEGQLELLDSRLHLCDVDEAFVEVDVDVEQVVEGVPVVYEQVQERTSEFHAQHYILYQ